MTDDEKHKLNSLIERLTDAPVQSKAEAKKKHKEAFESAFGRMLGGETYGEAMGGPKILNQSETDFRAELKSIDNDLDRQIEIVENSLEPWFSKGVVPAPYYAWRIAVILSKMKEKNAETAFLAAWCKHFGDTRGGRYEALAKRYKKLSS